MTTEQKERYESSCLGRYDESTNSYEELCECPEFVKCDLCGDYFEEEETERIDGLRYCHDCKKKYLDDYFDEFNNENGLDYQQIFSSINY